MAINPDGTMTRAPGEGLTVLDAITQNYLTKRTNRGGEEAETSERITLDPADPEGSAKAQGIDLRAALRDVAPGYNPGEGPIKLDAIVPDAAFRAPAKDDFGGILAIATTVAGFALGIPAPISAAFKFVMSGGENILGAITSAFLPSVSSFIGDAAGVADFASAIDASDAAAGMLGNTLDAGSTLAETVASTGVPGSARNILLENSVAGGTGDTSPGMRISSLNQAGPSAAALEAGEVATGSGASTAETALAERDFTTAPAASGKSWIDELLSDPKSRGGIIAGAITAGGSMLAGAANARTAKEISERNANTALALEDKRAANAQELARQQVGNAAQLDEQRRRFAQAGDFFGATSGVSAGNGVLRRADGTPVYQNGIIASRMT